MRIERFGAPREFLQRAHPFLLAREAEHNLILGVCANLVAQPQPLDTSDCYFTTVEVGGSVIGAAMVTPPHALVLSRLDSSEAMELIAQDVLARYGRLPGVSAPKPLAQAFAER